MTGKVVPIEPRAEHRQIARVPRILLLIKGLGKGGAEGLLVGAVRHADRSRFEYEIAYLLPWKDDLVADLAGLGAKVHCLDGARGAGWVGRMRQLVKSRGIDLIHVHSPYPAAAARLALPRSMPIVYTEHNVWRRYRAPTYWGNLLTFSRNRHVFAVSEHVRASIEYPRPMAHVRMPPVETLYHGVDHGAVEGWAGADGVRAELGIPEDVPVVGTVAHLKTHKGHRHLLDAAAIVRRTHPEARFVLVGRGPLEESLRRQARELGLDEAVVFTGFRDDALRVLASFDLFVLPSEHEGLPIALVEAMALGKPAVVTRVGGNPEVVRDGRDGRVVEPAKPGLLAEAIVDLLRDDGLRASMGEAARARAASFDIRRAVPRIEQVYQEILS